MRPRPVSYSSVAPLSPGQVPAPLPAGAPSYPPAKTWQTPLPSGAENVRRGSATSTRTQSRQQSVGSDPRMVGQPEAWDGGRESRPQQYQQQQTPSRPSSSYSPASPQVQQSPNSSYLPSQSIPQSYQSQAPTAFAPSPAQLQAEQQQQQQYHAQLLGYYYSYALQGLMAPATDPRQIRARDEAVARARNEGIYVVEEGAQSNGGTAGVGGQTMCNGNAAHSQQSNMGAVMSRRTSGPIISPAQRQASINPVPTYQPSVNTYLPNHQQPVYSVPPAHGSPAVPQSYIPQRHQGHQLPQPPPTRYQSPSTASPIPYVSSPDPAMSPPLPTPHRLPQPPITTPNYPQFASIPSSPSNSILNRASSLASSPSVYPPTHPVPIPNLARATSNATPGVGPFYTLPRSAARPVDLGRSDTIAAFASTASIGSGAMGKRPLPTPPVRAGTLPSGVGNGARGSPIVPTIANGFGSTSAGNVVPPAATRIEETVLNSTITGLSLNGGERVSSPTSPSMNIPSFSFGEDDNPGMPSIQIEGDDSTVPSFSFSDSPTVAPLPSFQLPTQSTSPPSTTRPAHYPPLHPRQDPSHPSHYLYAPTSTPHVISPDKSVYCARCNTQMFGRALMAMGREWHPECFRCGQEGCGVKLEHVQFDGKDGEVFCMVHFEELYATPCYHCKTPIAADEFITVSDERLTPPGPRTYHALHFFCASCGDPFVDPKSLAKGKEGTLAEPFMVKDGYPYCQKCDLRMFKPKCFGCKKGIVGDYAETGEGKWHLDCFTCCSCHKPLDGPYLVREDDEGGEKPYCYECYDIRARNE